MDKTSFQTLTDQQTSNFFRCILRSFASQCCESLHMTWTFNLGSQPFPVNIPRHLPKQGSSPKSKTFGNAWGRSVAAKTKGHAWRFRGASAVKIRWIPWSGEVHISMATWGPVLSHHGWDTQFRKYFFAGSKKYVWIPFPTVFWHSGMILLFLPRTRTTNSCASEGLQ